MDPKIVREQTVRDAKVGLILQSARKIFSEKGFSETRLEDIATAAGFSKASLYNYFNDKEEIFLSIAVYDFNEITSKVLDGLKNTPTFMSSLQLMLRTMFTYFGENYAFILAVNNYHSLMCTAMAQHPDLVKNFQCSYFELLKILTSIVDEAQKKQEIRCDMDTTTLSRFIGSLIHGLVFEWKVRGSMGNLEKSIQEIADFASYGVKFKSVSHGVNAAVS